MKGQLLAALVVLPLLFACDRPAPPPAAASAPTVASSPAAPLPAVSTTPFVQVATMKQLMDEVLEPAADHYWDAVRSTSDKNGTHEHAPKTADEWKTLRNQATVIAEMGNLLLMDGRATDRGDWIRFSQAMITAGARARDAAAAHDKTRVFDVGAELYDSCTNCHAKYMVQKYPMPDVPLAR